MDAQHFDNLAKRLSSRRSVFGGLLAGVLLPLEAAARNTGKQRKQRGKGKEKRKDKSRGQNKRDTRTTAQSEPCWRAGACIPGKGSNVSLCDLSGYSTFPSSDSTGSNLARANLRGVNARGVNFTRANLSGACLVSADFTGATFAKNTNLANAIFCNTIMPNGDTNDSGCGSVTACCPFCLAAGEACGDAGGASCCDGTNCIAGFCRECGTAATCPPPSGLCREPVCSPNGRCEELPTNGASCTRPDGTVARCFGTDCIPCSINGGQCGPNRVCCAGNCLSGACCALDGVCSSPSTCCNPTGAPQNRVCCQRRNGVGDPVCCIRGKLGFEITLGQGTPAPCTADSQCCSNSCFLGQCLDESGPSGCGF